MWPELGNKNKIKELFQIMNYFIQKPLFGKITKWAQHRVYIYIHLLHIYLMISFACVYNYVKIMQDENNLL